MEQISTLEVHQTKSKQDISKKDPLFPFAEDIRSAIKRDPAARNWFNVLINYSGLHAIWFYRFAHWLWNANLFFPARWLSQVARWLTGIEIHPAAKIGRRIFIDHGMGVVIGETAEIGDDVTIYHGVTLGGVSLEPEKRHPSLGNEVVVGAGAKILGAIEIGTGSRIGANAVVVKSVPPESVVVGVPGQVLRRNQKRAGDTPDLHHDILPDTLVSALIDIMNRLDQMEEKTGIHKSDHVSIDEEGCWKNIEISG